VTVFECNTCNKSSISTFGCMLSLPATEKSNSIKLIYKKMWYLLKNSQAAKKGAALCKMAGMKKIVKYRWQPRNGCDGRSVKNILIMTIQVNFVLIPGMRQHKFTWIVIIKIFVTDLPSQLFLGRLMYFTTFFIPAILHRAAPFLQLGCFWVD